MYSCWWWGISPKRSIKKKDVSCRLSPCPFVHYQFIVGVTFSLIYSPLGAHTFYLFFIVLVAAFNCYNYFSVFNCLSKTHYPQVTKIIRHCDALFIVLDQFIHILCLCNCFMTFISELFRLAKCVALFLLFFCVTLFCTINDRNAYSYIS